MNFWNNTELALRFKNNQVPSQERLLYYIIPLALYAFVGFFALWVLHFCLSSFTELTPSHIIQGKMLHFFEGLIQNINSYYTINANKTLSEIIPKEVFIDYKTSFEAFIHSNTSLKDIIASNPKDRNEIQTEYNDFMLCQIIDIILFRVLPISGVLICYKTNKMGDDKEFLERIIALSFPIALKAFCLAIPVFIIYAFMPYILWLDIIQLPFLIVLLYFYWQLNKSIKIASS